MEIPRYMRSIVAFSLSFVLAVTVGSLLLPETPRKASQTRPPASPVSPTLDFLPGLPALVTSHLDDAVKQHERAWGLLRAGQYSAAQNAYLQILIRNPQDLRAMQGLVTVQRLLTNQNPQKLYARVQAYRRSIATGQRADGQYALREMKLLIETSLSAAREISAEQNLRASSFSMISPESQLLPPSSSPKANLITNPVAAIKERISQLASSLRLTPTKAQAEITPPATQTGQGLGKFSVVPTSVTRHTGAVPVAQTPSRVPGATGPSRSTTVDPTTQPTHGRKAQPTRSVGTSNTTNTPGGGATRDGDRGGGRDGGTGSAAATTSLTSPSISISPGPAASGPTSSSTPISRGGKSDGDKSSGDKGGDKGGGNKGGGDKGGGNKGGGDKGGGDKGGGDKGGGDKGGGDKGGGDKGGGDKEGGGKDGGKGKGG
jgi:hypothetical protein